MVELAGLLALDAKVLCLDEPTAGLAQRETEAFGPLIVTVQRQLDASVLLIEHDMPLIMGISDRVYCLEAGTGHLPRARRPTVRDNPRVIASYLGTDERAINRSGGPPPGGLGSPHVGLAATHGRGAPHDRRHRHGAARGMGAACAARVADMVDVLLLVDRNEAPLAAQADNLAAARHAGRRRALRPRRQGRRRNARLAARAAELGPLRAVAHAAGVSPTMADWREILTINLIGTAPARRGVPSRWRWTAPPSSASARWRRCSRSTGRLPADAVLDDPLAARISSRRSARPCPRSRIRGWPTRGRSGACTGWSGVRPCAFGQVGARICSVTPGIIDTPMGRQEAAARDTNDMLVQMAAIKREGMAEEVAAGAAFLLSDEASFISGIDLPVDGGVVAAIRGGGATLT